MSSFLCFICHSTVNSDTNEELREKYKEVVGMNLCPDSHLCYICCHVLNKLWLFRSVCLKRSLEYPVLFSEKGTLNLHRNDVEIHILCPEENCHQNRNIYKNNFFENHSNHEYSTDNDYVRFEENFNDYKKTNELNNEYGNGDDEKSIPSREQEWANYDDVDEKEANFIGDEVELQNTDSVKNYNDGMSNEIIDNINDRTEISNDDNNDFNIPISILDTDLKNDTTDSENDLEEETHEINENIDKKEETIEDTKVKHKKKKIKVKKGFEKIILSVEEQKAELESNRKKKKYVEAEFKCYSCALGFLFKDTYQAHMMRHEESNGCHRCTTCSLRFATAAALRVHRTSHAERYKCICGRLLVPRARETHRASCLGEICDTAACHLCGNTFRNAAGLQQHVKRFHLSKTSNRTYSCNICGKTYNKQAAVRTHMIKHIQKKFECNHCTATFSSPYTLSQHKKKHEFITQEKHICETCGVSYNTRKSLLAHKRNSLNHQQVVFYCPICNRMCPTQSSLTSHLEAVHSNTKNYACNICGARYTNKKSLVRHIGAHTKVQSPKNAVCHLCGSIFKTKSKLNRHLKQVCEKAKLMEEFASYYDQ